MKLLSSDLPTSYWREQARKNGVKGSTWRMRRHRGMKPWEAAQPTLTYSEAGKRGREKQLAGGGA